MMAAAKLLLAVNSVRIILVGESGRLLRLSVIMVSVSASSIDVIVIIMLWCGI